jgi:uncharacterized protein (TIGR02680 family)
VIGAPSQNVLPQPAQSRWQPLRVGLIELYHYDVEEFWFRDGHLLLRGNNGTGKSKVLSLTLPFLLDANLSSARVEPDGDRHKRMEWNLLMNGRHERRIGYTWIEFGRRDESGQSRTLTLGCGLRAIAGRTSVDAWFFITEQRIGADLWLTTPERTALSRERLIEALGTRGQVFDTAQAYRRAVDENLFRLGTERYAALVDTLIQLRQPQLSKQPNEERLSAALTEALPPLDHAALEDVAEAMSQLEDIRRELDELEAMRKSVATFGNRYRRYAQVASRRRARLLRQAQSEFDTASRDLKLAEEELERARADVTRYRNAEQQMDAELADDSTRLSVLQADPAMRDARRIADERQRAAQCRRNVAEADNRITKARDQLQKEEQAALRRKKESSLTRTVVLDSQRGAATHAAQAGLAEAHARSLGETELPDGADRAPHNFCDSVLQTTRESEARRRDQINLIRKRLSEVKASEQARTRAHDVQTLHADAFDTASESLRQVVGALREAAAGLVASWQRHSAALRILKIPDSDDLLAELEAWVESLDGPNPLRAALDRARQSQQEHSAAREAQLAEERKKLDVEQDLLRAERARLQRGENRAPPAPHTRGADVRTGRVGAPLWQLIDFNSQIAGTMRAGLEAALEAAGLLDAWVMPDGIVLDAQTHDVMLLPRAASESAQSLADWLIPTIPNTGRASAIDTKTLTAVLRSIACGDHDTGAQAWVSQSGEFRLGSLRGAWNKPQAVYIGHAAREAARHARLVELTVLLAAIDAALAECAAAIMQLAATRQLAHSESASAPSDDALQRAHAQRNAAEQHRRDAQTRLGEAQYRLAAAEHAHSRARDALAMDAGDLNIPIDAEGIDQIEWALNHQAALAELAEQLRRESQAHEELDACLSDHGDKHKILRESEETVRTLQATVGKKVDELLSEIEATKAAQRAHEEALKRARAELIVASAARGTTEQRCDSAHQRLEERTQSRKQSIEGLQSFATDTGLLSVALPDIALPATDVIWGIEVALTLARRTEQSLAEVAAEDSDWHRIQQEISRDLNELQGAMSAQGHAVTADVTDNGLIVRIVYRLRPERPDTMQQHLEADLAERRLILSAQEREVLENHLQKEIAANLQRMIQETLHRVASINTELHSRPTSTGLRYRLDWQVLPEDAEDSAPGLAEARKRLLKTSADAWSADDRRQVGEFLQSRVASERARDDQSTLFDSLARALDYRRWHRFRVQRLQDGAWKPLSGPASSGERALGLTVPLFAAASSHYESADVHAPRLVLLDEAFAGIDDEARANCMALIREFDLDFVMTSEREWGCYPQLPGLSICQLVRREGMDAVLVSRWSWDGRVRRAEDIAVQRFPDPTTTGD